MKPLTEFQRGLQYFNGCYFLPNSVDGTGAWDSWDAGSGTVSHAVVGTAFDTQFKRTVWTNDGTINRMLGPRKANTGDYQFWLGDKRFCGGFYFSTVVRLEAWAGTGVGSDGRLFIGLTAGASANCISDTLQNNTMGFFHKSTDGPNVINFILRDGSAHETSVVVADSTHSVGMLAAGNTLLFEIWHFPNGISPASAGLTGLTVNFKLSYFDTTTASDGKPANRVLKKLWSESGFTAASSVTPVTTMFAPQVQMSNAADTTAGHYSIGIANIYCAPWSGEMD